MNIYDSEFGRLDILINNVAVPYESIIAGSYQDWQYILNTNLLGYMACSHEAVKRMKENGAAILLTLVLLAQMNVAKTALSL